MELENIAQRSKEIEKIDPLYLEHWEFYIVSTVELNKHFPTQKTVSLASISKITEVASYVEIKEKRWIEY